MKRRRWPRRLGIAALVLFALLALAFAIIWPMRVELAKGYIDDELARRGVAARYDVTRIGFGTQIFENLVIGDPRRPDLTARRVEVQVLIGLFGPRIGLITAQGVRMRGRIENGRLTLGELDKLLTEPGAAPSTEPFRLPDQRLDISDTALTLATPAGEMVLAFSGRGNLSNGFRGGLAFVSNELRAGDCVATRMIARLTLRVERARPHLHGPAALGRLHCGGVVAERALFALRGTLSPEFDHWRGASATRITALRMEGGGLAGVEGRLTFDGDMARTAGTLAVDSGAVGAGTIRAAAARFEGGYTLSPRGGDMTLDGKAGLRGLIWGGADTLAASLGGARGSPVGPVADALAAALRAAGRSGADASAKVEIAYGRGAGQARLRELALVAQSGAQLLAASGTGIVWQWPSGQIGMDGEYVLSGGGFPETRLNFAQAAPGAPIEGRARIAPMTARGSRLALGDIFFTAAPGGDTSFRTTALVDGPVADGRVSGLAVPITGRFGPRGFAIGESCVTTGFRALQVQGLRIGPTRLPLCPIGRAMVASGPRGIEIGAELRDPRLAGHLGAAPVALSAARLRITSAGFAATRPAAGIGWGFQVTRFEAASLDGRFTPGGMAGRFEGLAGELSGVPLLFSEARGNWRLRGADLSLDGRLTVTDAQEPVRFNPLASEDVRLTLVNGRVHGTGTLAHPASGTRVALATIDHNLGSGAGRAVLDVPGLAFTPAFQPEALTPLTLGIVALVNGSLSGQGRIEWDSDGTRSSGHFETDNASLAAPFGPVEGLTTRIEFTDLLGLTSAPGQSARVRLVRTGIDVYDGEIGYQLQPDYHVAVESARWPLAGGTLTLEPTILDFSQESTKYLTFRVEALDAARFIAQLEFSNIAATGTYDGVIPMQFTQAGGRIVNGRLIARAPGGTLSYVGELTDQDLGAYGVLAFDALKSLRYSRLDITLDGALDGEFLTRIDLDGIARDTAGTRVPAGGIQGMVVGRVLGQLARIPFHFNIRIQGPFRALVATARSFQDPGDLIRASLPQLIDAETQAEPRVQPQDSGDVR